MPRVNFSENEVRSGVLWVTVNHPLVCPPRPGFVIKLQIQLAQLAVDAEIVRFLLTEGLVFCRRFFKSLRVAKDRDEVEAQVGIRRSKFQSLSICGDAFVELLIFDVRRCQASRLTRGHSVLPQVFLDSM